MYTRVKTPEEIENMRTSGRMLATVHALLRDKVVAGVSTKELDDIAARELKKLGGTAAFYKYPGGPGVQPFPGVICISVNDEVVHGIPGTDTIIKDGDIVSLDFGVIYKGMITDSAISVICGEGTSQARDLVKYTEKSMYDGIGVVKDGCRTGDIGYAVEQTLNKHKYGIVRDLVGHGVGHAVHEDPNIPNYGRKNTGDRLNAGMTICIEPMATLGRDAVEFDSDGWTVRTVDGSLAAHFEHTVLITEDGYEILTQL
jgi:methionyl aminopeptidase